MPIRFKSSLDFFGDALGKIMVVTGFLLLIATIALFSKAYQWASMASFMSGVFLVVVGIVLNYESPKLKVPSREGWGTILVCISTLFMAGAVATAFYAVVGSVFPMPARWGRPGAGDFILLVDLKRPNLWLTPIFAWTGIGLMISGIVLKFSREVLG